MQNIIPKSMNGLLAMALNCQNGATEQGEAIGLEHINADVLQGARTAAVNSRTNYKGGAKILSDRRKVVNSVTKSGRRFATIARDMLKPSLGDRYSHAWDATGFVGSLAVPTEPDGVATLLENLGTYFTGHPDVQVDVRNVTAVQAASLFTSLTNALTQFNTQNQAVDDLLIDQRAKFAALKKCLRDLINELGTLLGPLDARWLVFGLNKPGAAQTPNAPANFRVVLNGTTGTATWDASPRAEHYRLWKKVVGVDTDAVAVDRRSDLMFVFTELPANATIELAVSAINEGGESPLSQPVIVTTH